MSGVWVIGEPTADGGLARISTEVATLAVELAGAAGAAATGIMVAADPDQAAEQLARFVPNVVTIADEGAADRTWSAVAASRLAGLVGNPSIADLEEPDVILVGSGPDGRDLAGALSAMTGLAVLTSATGATWADGGPTVEMSAFGGKLITTSAFTSGHGIVTVRPNAVTAQPAPSAGAVRAANPPRKELPVVQVVDRVSEAGAAAPIEEARIIVAGGRGVGGSDGFRLVEELAEALDGVVGATRAAVDSGWISYSQQIGQTGKIVKPELYLALGISGAIQHKVGMQTAGTIVAVNRDPDSPIADFADLLVVGDLFEVGGALLEQLRERSG